MGTEYLMDTSAVIKYLSKTFPEQGISFIDKFINADCTISFITEIELQVWQPLNPDNIAIYQLFVAKSQIIHVNATIIAETIRIRRDCKLKMADAIIAATALAFKRTLVADNDDDFKKVPSLSYINPRHL
jgi:predicted nucleic acid-binding protein